MPEVTKFKKPILLIIASLITFIGPTYFVYAMRKFLGLAKTVLIALGFILFICGLILMFLSFKI